ncbi:uncharacterized protein EURHEDRAFT_404236 [Aspergillus ruber CBS 135680]|uniref:Uncharacterized protein n=1 Tax=Aspergillus ruber (strain CBS 135680) TaxID=1388766 RepID=A0A017SA00_ASPRC|nr:uncharacterized protein EURHEDRAFT_404236 [Aspergillus ruber CBS 135680]EYE93464.1 hypothetical protein EURHEDRAFT_404236 [Aspergillus ruber CBS 135680]
MHTTVGYSLGGTAIALTVIATILDGVCYAWTRSSFELAVLSLSVVGCVVLALLLVIQTQHPRTKTKNGSWGTWQHTVHILIVAYLLLAAGTTAGIIAKSLTTAQAQAQFITRNIFWAFSVIAQAISCGFHLVPRARQQDEENTHSWPRPLSHELERLDERHSDERTQERSDSPSLSITVESNRPSLSLNPKTSTDGLAPVRPCMSNVVTRVSSRYSGKTLFQQDSKHESIDLHAGVMSSPSKPDVSEGRDTCSVADQEHQSTTTTTASTSNPAPKRTDSDVRSMDSLLILPSPPSPTEPSVNLESIATTSMRPHPPKLILPSNEKNIHPLFRSDSPSPPPTPMPGTIVKASPVAGTTISARTLSRVRSSNSLRVSNNGRSHSPLLLERMGTAEEGEMSSSCPPSLSSSKSKPMPGIIMAGDLRKSMLQYEKKYDLNESPLEN